MKKQKSISLAALVMVLLSGCASGPLPKNQSLLNAETAYSKSKNDPDVQKYAKQNLQEVGRSLQAAAKAETKEEMTSLSYIASTQNQIALLATETRKAEQKYIELDNKKNDLVSQSLRAEQVVMEGQLTELQAKETVRGMMLTLGDLLFVKGKAEFQPEAIEPIIQIADFMKQHPEKIIIIEGHTDDRGGSAYNTKLSLKRAEFVQSELLHRGIPAYKMTAIGFGQSQPVASNSTEEGRQKNRRVDIIIQH